jgi:hypothetical protein
MYNRDLRLFCAVAALLLYMTILLEQQFLAIAACP